MLLFLLVLRYLISSSPLTAFTSSTGGLQKMLKIKSIEVICSRLIGVLDYNLIALSSTIVEYCTSCIGCIILLSNWQSEESRTRSTCTSCRL
jgi:hypothetical protein